MTNNHLNNKADSSNTSNFRRNFLKKSAMAAPVIATAAAKPAWGAEVCVLSGSLSGNLSQNGDGNTSTCNGPVGKSPGYWSKWEKITSSNSSKWDLGYRRICRWHEAGYKLTDSFSGIFGYTPTGSVGNSLGAVMRVSAGTDSFERHAIAALLSASHPDMRSQVPYTASQVVDAFKIVAQNPGTQRAADIIQIFDAIFSNHAEPSFGSLSGEKLKLTYIAQLCVIAGKSLPSGIKSASFVNDDTV